MTSDRTTQLIGTGHDVSAAIADLLGQIVGILDQTDIDAVSSDISTRIRGEGRVLDSVVRDLINQVGQIGTEFDAAVTSVAIDGIRPISEGFRIWGIVGLSSDQPPGPNTVRCIGQPDIRQTPTDCVITAQIAII